MDGPDLDLFERSLRHATDSHTGSAVDAALEELGWLDALAVDPRTAVSLLFELQGAANATSSAIDRVLFDKLGLAGGILPAGDMPGGVTRGGVMPAGDMPGDVTPGGVMRGMPAGVVLPALGQWSPPGALDGSRLTICGLGTAALAQRETAVVVARADHDEVAVVVPLPALTVRRVHGIDPRLGLVEVTLDAVPVDVDPQPVLGWAAAVALAQVAVGHELVGASKKMLELARDHALERIQFGRPISKFQAIRHRLAETLVAIEMATAVLDAAWSDRSPQTAAMAKALAGRGARTAARHCQQVLAGIGFTTEHPLHRYIRRVLVLDQLFGAALPLTTALGNELVATRKLPAALPL